MPKGRTAVLRSISQDDSATGSPRIRGPKPDCRFACLLKALKAQNVGEVRAQLGQGLPVNYSEPAMGKKTPLISAAEYGFVDAVVELLGAGANVSVSDATGATPLHMAAGGGHLATVRLLLTHGAHVNAIDCHASTPLHYAARADIQEATGICVVEALLAAGARCGLRNREGHLPLHNAATAGSAALVRVLARKPYKATINLKDNEGRSPLHCAVLGGRSLSVVAAILRLGSNIDSKDAQGQTALHLAAKRQMNYVDDEFDGACLELLLSHGAAVNITDEDGYNALSLALRRTMWWGRPCARDNILHAVQQLVAKGSCVQDGFAMWRMVESFPSLVPIALNRSFCSNTSARDSPYLRIDLDFSPLTVNAQQLRQSQRQSPLLPQTDVPKVLLQETEVSMLQYMLRAGQKRLFLHPLCHSFLHLKWYKVRKYFLANVFFYLLFVLSLTVFLLTSQNCPENAVTPNSIANTTADGDRPALAYCGWAGREAGLVGLFWWCLVIMSALLDLREFIQLLQNPVLYIWNLGNIVDATLVLCVPQLLVGSRGGEAAAVCCLGVWQQKVGAVSVVLAWVRLMLFTGQFPSFGVYIVMFSTVARNVLKFLALYLFVLVAFGLGFHVLLRSVDTFASPVISLITSLVMMTGELGYEDTFLTSHRSVLSITMLVVFIVLVYIILSNLLVGLAVSDMYAIQQRSEVLRLTRHVELMVQVEKLFRSRLLPSSLQRCLLRSIAIMEPNHRPTVSIYPNSKRGFADRLFLLLTRTLRMRRLFIKVFEMFISGFLPPEHEPSLPPQLVTAVLDVALREHELDKRERLLPLRALQLGAACGIKLGPGPGPGPQVPPSQATLTRAPSVARLAGQGRASWRWTMADTDNEDDLLEPLAAPAPLWPPPNRVLSDPNVRLEEVKSLVLHLQNTVEVLTKVVQQHVTAPQPPPTPASTPASPATSFPLATVNEVVV